MESEFADKVIQLSREGSWREVLKLNEKSDKIEARKLLWVWPSEDNLWFIRDAVVAFKCAGVISIGCGCGLLEWIIQKSTGLTVVGYEVNREWWESKYSVPSFIKMKYCSQPPDESALNPEYALLFCYFNNALAFLDYIRVYRGRVVIIVGPAEGKGHHTDPAPFDVQFEDGTWKLFKFQEVKDSKDFIAIYVKCI
nr:unnamed protein product [Callosobruchus analis]